MEQNARAASNGGRASVLRGEGVPEGKVVEAQAGEHRGVHTKLKPPTIWSESLYIALSAERLSVAAKFIAEGELSYANAQMETREGYKGVGGCSLC